MVAGVGCVNNSFMQGREWMGVHSYSQFCHGIAQGLALGEGGRGGQQVTSRLAGEAAAAQGCVDVRQQEQAAVA